MPKSIVKLKTISKPTKVEFYHKNGATVSFNATKTFEKDKYFSVCPECGQSVDKSFWLKKMKKAGLPSLGKLIIWLQNK